MRASIYDVAKAAGVSISTVSRYLTGATRVSAEKRAAIDKAVKELNYIPSELARGLARNQTGLVGLCMFSERSVFDSRCSLEIFRGVEAALDDTSYSIVLLKKGAPKAASGQYRPLEYIQQNKIDGLILTGIDEEYKNSGIFKSILKHNYPVIYMGRRVSQIGMNIYAHYDDYMAETFRIFFGKGHRKIAVMLNGESNTVTRFEAIRDDFLKECSTQVSFYLTRIVGGFYPENYLPQVEQCMLKEGCTAVYMDDLESAGAVNAFMAQKGRFPGKDYDLISVEFRRGDGDSLFPPVDAFYVPAYEMGRCAASMMLGRLRDHIGGTQTSEFFPEYQPRGSCTGECFK